MDVLTITTILICISGFFSCLNERFLKLPGTIGVVSISVTVSVIILIDGKTNYGAKTIVSLAKNIDFSKVLMDVLLGFLLFASALHFDYQKLKEQRWSVFLLNTIMSGEFLFNDTVGLILFVVFLGLAT